MTMYKPTLFYDSVVTIGKINILLKNLKELNDNEFVNFCGKELKEKLNVIARKIEEIKETILEKKQLLGEMNLDNELTG